MSSIKDNKFTILRQPVITEKGAHAGSTANCVVFEIHPRANKLEVKSAVEKIFDVKVKSVRTMNTVGKVKRVRTSSGRQKARKKAYVYLEAGHSIDVIEGL